MGVGGIVLAGGRSTRMGRPKTALDWHGTPLLAHVAGVLEGSLDGAIVVVGAPGQQLPRLPQRVELVADTREGRGPLEGIAAGLRALAGRAETAFVSAADVPFLHPAFVRRVVACLQAESDVAVPVIDGRMHPLASAYRISLLPLVELLLAEQQLRASSLLERARVRWLDEATLLADPAVRTGDPQLDSLRNLNTPEEYEAALLASRRPASEV